VSCSGRYFKYDIVSELSDQGWLIYEAGVYTFEIKTLVGVIHNVKWLPILFKLTRTSHAHTLPKHIKLILYLAFIPPQAKALPW